MQILTSVVIPIRNNLDIVTARSMLRDEVHRQSCWTQPFHARAASALTSMAELVLFSHATGTLQIGTVERGDELGIELRYDFSWLGEPQSWRELSIARRQLVHLTDDVTLTGETDRRELVVRIWPALGEVRC